ncbi:MAG: N-acetylmuramoyl-L-alanine amidase [Actinobacteria bacterium]|nr:N-acetylmuramoyl-L-alanine amidase [Actinomycetota bacterium]
MLAGAGVVAALLLPAGPATAPDATSASVRLVAAPAPRLAGDLADRVIVVDPGHQLGNHNFPRKIGRRVPAGGFTKPCNTTGTATDGGYPEATFAWRVARQLRRALIDRGAQVVLTRHSNREDRWGPCVDVRGRAGNAVDADLKISIHGDGSTAPDAHGFHVIAPIDRKPWTHDIFSDSTRLATTARQALDAAGFDRATYVAGGDGLDFRGDLATLNLSDVPTILVELGNMRDSGDAQVMTSADGQAAYAAALVEAVRRYLR